MSGALGVTSATVSTYSLPNAARILKVAPSRLRYWKRTRLAVPSAAMQAAVPPDGREAVAEASLPASAEGHGADSQYDFRDLVGIRAVLSLLESGISLRSIRRSVEILRQSVPEIEDPLVALRLWSEGSPRVVVEHEGHLIEPGGQLLLDFVEQAMAKEPAGVEPIRSAPKPGGAAGAPETPAESAGEWFERGCQLDSEPDTFTQALEAYRRAIELDAEFADAHCNLGALFFNNGDRAEARRHFERCLRLQPTHVEAHFNLANLLEEEGCDEMSLHHYRAALDADPFYPDLHINLALLCEKTGLAAKALDHWRRYLQLDPEGTWAEVARLRLREPEA